MRYGQWKVLAKLNEGSVKKLTNLTAELLPRSDGVYEY